MLNSAFENRIVLAFRRLYQSCPYSCMEAAYNRAYFHSYVGGFSVLSVQLSNGFSALSVQLSNTNKGQKQSLRILPSRLKVERTSSARLHLLHTFKSQYGLGMI